MNLLIPAAIGAGVLILGWGKIKGALGLGAAPGSGAPNQPAGTVNELQTGRVYAVVAMMQPSGGADPAIGANHLSAYFTSAGFQMMSVPALRDAIEQAKYASGQPAAWQFLARWTRPEKYVTAPSDPSIGMAMFTPAPVA